MAFSLEIDGPDRERILRTKASFPGAQKKQGSGKLMSKGFGTQPESKISNTEFLKEETEDQQGHMTSLPPSLGGGYEYPGAQVVRPLEHRMEPRDEFATFHLPRKYDRSPLDSDSLDSNSLISPITEARNRGDTNAILTGRISDEDLEHSGEEGSLNDVSFEQALPRPKRLDVTNKQQIEYVAFMNAHDKKGTENWRYYLECYVKVWKTSPLLCFLQCLTLMMSGFRVNSLSSIRLLHLNAAATLSISALYTPQMKPRDCPFVLNMTLSGGNKLNLTKLVRF